MIDLRHEEETYTLRGLIFEVRQKLKTGWPEEVYHQAIVELLRSRNIPFRSKPRKTIRHRGVEVKVLESDLVERFIWDEPGTQLREYYDPIKPYILDLS